ncbi:PilT/PilU family type 4a pilus ATPase [Desulforhopalus vacuolatus]|uniref:type IV pilus twitching motility protein PilT n=1 Tax=Desulforhopalus vacuolatus TaxID=40414 RepID=UPI001965A277|nr:PilT/PilU family type 4a pilus ATPase [Desulforhopalus vacuolatus]MBM9519695.1 PilT/PilU family type 4a pilus ATPase [Desulforhopalus vacuolatus]
MKKNEIDYWIARMLEAYKNVSDLNITVGKTLQVESDGVLMPVDIEPPVRELTPFQTEVFALNLIGNNRRMLKNLVSTGSCDLSYHLGDQARFRVNIFTQKGYLTTVLRKLQTAIPTITGMQFPESFVTMANEINGLVLFTGATGSGKTTSLAALLNQINEKRAVHVVTLEDPIEYVHKQKKATFNQRELGSDFDSFAAGLRAALRQAPKVILVGEMRDRESMEIALTAAETGHLVLSTLHTIDAGQTMNRIISMFDQDEQNQVRSRLVDTIKWVASQRLLPRVGGGRIAAMEIMRISLRIKNLILNGETEDKTYYSIIEEGSALQMWTFDQHLLELYSQGLITEENAVTYCSQRSLLNRGLDQIKSGRGELTFSLNDLSMEEEEQAGKRRRKKGEIR